MSKNLIKGIYECKWPLGSPNRAQSIPATRSNAEPHGESYPRRSIVVISERLQISLRDLSQCIFE